jgi:hypothetical protein
VDAPAVAAVADARVARAEQVRSRLAGAAGVVGEHDVGVDEARRAVDEYDRDAGLAVAHEVAVVGAGGHDDEPVDAARQERLDEVALALGVLVGAAGERQHTALARDVLDAALERGVEGVRDVVEDEASGARPSGRR